jgi:hypothetical protein
VISTGKSFIFIHIPKSAGNSIQEVLLAYSDDSKTITSHQDGVERFGIAGKVTKQKHATLVEYERILGPEKITGFLKFCVVRNPWERAISNYLSPHRWMEKRADKYCYVTPTWDEERFLRLLGEMKPAVEYVKNSKGNVQMDRVIRFENLENDYREVCRELGIASGDTLRHRNRTPPNSYRRTFYDSPRLIQAVADTMAEDIERWHYKPACE